MKYSLSLMVDPDLHTAAKKFAHDNNMSFARLVNEALCAILGHNRAIDPDLLAIIKERIATHPGRQKLTPEEVERRWAEHDRLKKEKKIKKREAEIAALRATRFDDRDLPPEERDDVTHEDNQEYRRIVKPPNPFEEYKGKLVWSESRGEFVKEEDLER